MVAVFGENARVFARIVAFVLPLGLDTLAIAVALGLRGQRPLRPALLFVVFETTMPLIGIVIGRVVGLWFEAGAAYLGGLILLAVGLHMLQEARFRQTRHKASVWTLGERSSWLDSASRWTRSQSVFHLGALRLPIVAVLGAIAIQTFLVTVGGILIGQKIGLRLGVQASRLAGIAAGVAFLLLGGWVIFGRLFFRSDPP